MVIEISYYVVLTGFCWLVEVSINQLYQKHSSLSLCCEEKLLWIPLSVKFPYETEETFLMKQEPYSFKEHEKEIYMLLHLLYVDHQKEKEIIMGKPVVLV